MALEQKKMVAGALAKIFAKVTDRHIAVFIRTGEEFANDCKESHRWINRTGNLASSIGYIILLNGMVIKNGLIGSSEGVEAGKNAALKVADKRGLELIGIAGMEYAVALEAKGYNVITVQSKWALFNLSDRIKKIKGIQ
jgi:hypothetical protein